MHRNDQGNVRVRKFAERSVELRSSSCVRAARTGGRIPAKRGAAPCISPCLGVALASAAAGAARLPRQVEWFAARAAAGPCEGQSALAVDDTAATRRRSAAL